MISSELCVWYEGQYCMMWIIILMALGIWQTQMTYADADTSCVYSADTHRRRVFWSIVYLSRRHNGLVKCAAACI